MSQLQFNWQTPGPHDDFQSYYYDTPAGQIIINTYGKILSNMEWLVASASTQTTLSLPDNLQKELNCYWLGTKAEITTPLLAQGTHFQRKVWRALCQIPFAQTTSYGTLAKELQTSPRALANACRKNPFPLIIPCHRVLAKSGIGGYAGEVSGKLVDIKKALLLHEQMLAHDI